MIPSVVVGEVRSARCVAIIGANDERIPEPSALTDKSADEVQHRLDINRERCLLHVAPTRARVDL